MKRWKCVLIVFILIWMVAVFMFSNQPASTSKKTSGKVIEFFIETFCHPESEKEKEKMIESWQTITRKMAHFTVYTIGGIILESFMYMVIKDSMKKRVFFSFLIGVIYAIGDEIHQKFVVGRSCEFRDVLIDSAGVMLGILITIGVITLKNKHKEKSLHKFKKLDENY